MTRLSWIALLIVLSGGVLGTQLARFPVARAVAPSYLSIDVETYDNERNAIGLIESCTSVDVGEQFGVDIVVRDVENLVAWELRLEFDNELVTVVSVDHDQFLLSSDGEGVTISPRLFDVEKPNRIFVGAGEVRGNPESGSGVLARIFMQAVAPGVSQLRIPSTPTVLGPRLSNDVGEPISDADGDGIWDGGISHAQIAVGGSCDDLVPIPTPPPTPGPAHGDDGPGSTAGGSTSSDNGNGGSDSVSAGTGVSVVDDGDGSDGTGSDSGEDSSSRGVAGGEGGGDDTSSDGSGDNPGEASEPASHSEVIGLGILPIAIGIGAIAAVIIGGALLVGFRRRGVW